MVAINRNSKPDTVLFLDFAAGNDEIDYSQMRTNITNNTTYLSEANSARTALDGPREISIVLDVTSGETGVLLDHGNGVTYSYRIDIVATNSVRCRINGTTIMSATIPNMVASDRVVIITWNTRPVGGTDYFSELFVTTTNVTSTPAVASATHSILAADPTHTLTIGAANGGASAFAGGLDFHYVRIGRRFHSMVEGFEDWGTESSPTAPAATIREPPLVPDGDTLTTLGDEDALVGPGHLMAGYAVQQADRRLTGPLGTGPVLATPSTPVAITYEFVGGSEGWWKLAPDDDVLHIGLPLLFYVPVPSHCNRIRVRVGVKQVDSSTSTTAEVRYRGYSMSGLPMVGEGIGPFVYHRTPEFTSTVETVTSAGFTTVHELGSMGVAVDDWGCTWLTVAIGFTPGDPLLATTTVGFYFFAFDPYYDADATSALDLALGE